MLLSEITRYFEMNYLSIEQLSLHTHLSIDELHHLIAHHCIPQHSHRLLNQMIVHSDIFGENVFSQLEKHYYHPSLIPWAIKANAYLSNHHLNEVALKMKADFISDLRDALSELDDAKQTFHYCFNQNNELSEEGIELFMQQHWPYVMDGTYGVCLKIISAKNMVKKLIAVSEFEKWLALSDERQDAHHHARLLRYLDIYDQVAASFGPHEIEKSTRGRLYNRLTCLLAVTT